jgi:hypothetical protein
MSEDDDNPRDTPTTGIAIPRPKPRAVHTAFASVEAEPTEPPAVKPPKNPSLEEIWRLIDERIPPQIAVRLSSIPPPESRPSKAVQAAKTTGRWTKWAMAGIGILAVVGQVFAEVEKFRGPIGQALVIIARVLDSQERSAPPIVDPASAPIPQAEP